MSEWKEYKLGDIVDVAQGLAINAKTKHLLSDSGLPLLRITDLIHNTQVQFVKKELAPKQTIALEEDIIYTRTGQVGLVFKGKIGIIHNNCFKVIPKNNKVTRNYIYWFLRQSVIKEIANSIASGSVQKDLNHSAFKSININVPEIGTQNSITEVLSSLDDKIELNNKINQELESLAQLLFKRWFVDFEFPNVKGEPYKSSGGEMVDSELGEIPKGWKVKKLKQILNIKRGGSPRPIHDYMASSGLPWVKISDATALNSPFLFSTKEFIKAEGLKKTILIKKGSLILSNSATPGLPIFLELDACIHDGWLHFQDIQDVNYNFLYLLFLCIRKDLVGQGNGSIFINLKTDILKEYSISIPSKEVLGKFSDSVNNIFDTIKNNSSENIELMKLRDFLLPKLISGELQIKEN